MAHHMSDGLRAPLRAALPTLRIIAMVYTGLSAVAGLVVLISIAAEPKVPAAREVAEPAREAVSQVLAPTSQMVDTLMPEPAGPIEIRPAAINLAPFVASTALDVTILDAAPADDQDAAGAQPLAPAPAVRSVRRVAQPVRVSPEADIEDVASDDQPAEADVPPPPAPQPDVVEQPVDVAPMQQAATVDAPRALPTLVLPRTAKEVKAYLDAQNQAAIDAEKASQAQAKAQADAANQAAIDAIKAQATSAARAAEAGPALAPAAAAVLPADPTPTPRPADARATAAQAKARADAANQAAIDAARTQKSAGR